MAKVLSPGGTGGKESLRTELASARSKLTSLHQEKENLMQNMRELQSILDKERKELREVLGSAKAKIDQTDKEKKAVEHRLVQSEGTVRDQAARIVELEDLLRRLRAELATGGSSMTAVSSAVTFISSASSMDDHFSREWSTKSRQEPSISVLDPLVIKLRSCFDSESNCQAEFSKLQQGLHDAEARHARELAALQRRLDDELASKAKLAGACDDADGRYQTVAAELARNNQEIHSWRTEERLSMERSLSDLRAQLESSRSAIDELTHTVSQRDQTVVKLEHEVASLAKLLSTSRESLGQLQSKHSETESQLCTASYEVESLSTKLSQSQHEIRDTRERHTAEMSHEQQVHHSETLRLRTQLEEAEASLSGLQAELLRLEHSIQSTQAELAESLNQVSLLQTKIETLTSSHRQELTQLSDTHHTEISTMKRRIGELENQLARLQAELDHATQTGSSTKAQLKQDLADALSKIHDLESSLAEALRMIKQQQNEFEIEISTLKSDNEEHVLTVHRKHETTLQSLQREISVLETHKSELASQISGLELSLKDEREMVLQLRAEIEELRARLKATADQLAQANAALASQNSSSGEMNAAITKLESELEELRKQLQTALHDLEEAQAAIFAFKVAAGMEKMEAVLWNHTTVCFVTDFYQWRAEAHEGAMQRGAEELREIVGTVDTSGPGPNLDDFNIEAFDVASYASSAFGL